MDFKVGDKVVKTAGDYVFEGWIVARYFKRGNPDALRFVVEDERGLNLIMSPHQIRLVEAV